MHTKISHEVGKDGHHDPSMNDAGGKKPGWPSNNAERVSAATSLRNVDFGPTHSSKTNGSLPITHLYLTFDTVLPTDLCWRQERRNTTADMPAPPDLKPYMSPLQWSPARKNTALTLSCLATFLTAYTAGCYSPPAGIIAHDLDSTRLVVLIGITTFCCGFAIAPMALAPLSEVWGRYPVFMIAGIIFVTFQLASSFMTHIAGLLVARFLVGVGASVFSAVVGGVIADLWDRSERNTPMALFSGFVLAGTGAGPLVASIIIERMERTTRAWKWTFWHQVILDGVLLGALALLFEESRASVLLARKARVLNDWYEALERKGLYGMTVLRDPALCVAEQGRSVGGESDEILDKPQTNKSRLLRIRWVVQDDEQRLSIARVMASSVGRPFSMLLTEPIVFCFSLWAAFSWAILYLSFSAVPYLYQNDFDLSSRVYGAIIAAAAVATTSGILQQHLLRHPQWRSQHPNFKYETSPFWAFMRRHLPTDSPESRLYISCITALFLPAGLFGAFLSQDATAHAVAVGIGFAVWGIYAVYLASFNYLADSYQVYASSALAALNFCRNVLGGVFPVVVSTMFTRLGRRGAGGMLGGVAMVLSVIPWALVVYGEKIRARSKLAVALR